MKIIGKIYIYIYINADKRRNLEKSYNPNNGVRQTERNTLLQCKMHKTASNKYFCQNMYLCTYRYNKSII